MIAKTVDKNLTARVIDSRNQIWIDDRVVDHQSRVIFIGRIRCRGILRLDEIDRRNRGVSKVIEDRDRRRVGVAVWIIGVENITVLKFGLIRDHGCTSGYVHAQLDV